MPCKHTPTTLLVLLSPQYLRIGIVDRCYNTGLLDSIHRRQNPPSCVGPVRSSRRPRCLLASSRPFSITYTFSTKSSLSLPLCAWRFFIFRRNNMLFAFPLPTTQRFDLLDRFSRRSPRNPHFTFRSITRCESFSVSAAVLISKRLSLCVILFSLKANSNSCFCAFCSSVNVTNSGNVARPDSYPSL